VHSVGDARLIEAHTAEPLVPGPNRYETEIATANLKNYNMLCSDQTATDLVQAKSDILRSKIHNLLNFMLNREELRDPWKESTN
jgi:hypothetical protein